MDMTDKEAAQRIPGQLRQASKQARAAARPTTRCTQSPPSVAFLAAMRRNRLQTKRHRTIQLPACEQACLKRHLTAPEG